MSWREQAACRGDDRREWLSGEMTLSMARMCWECPVRPDCLFEALQQEDKCDPGVWGGTTELERRRIRQDRNEVRRIWVELGKVAS